MLNLLFRNYRYLLTFISIMIFIALSMLSYLSMQVTMKTSEWIFHSFDVIDASRNVLLDIDDTEDNQKYYFLTSNPAYLKAYFQTQTQVNKGLESLTVMTQDNPVQQENIKNLKILFKTYIDLINLSINNQKTGVNKSAATDDKLEKLFDQLVISNNEMIDTEMGLLVKRKTDRLHKRKNFLTSLFVLNIFSFGLILFCFYSLMREISSRRNIEKKMKKSEENLMQLAYFDSLTGLGNRAQLIKVLEDSILQAEKKQTYIALLFIDLDNFKDVNDMLSHEVGDSLLKIIGNHIRNVVGNDKFVARLGGDEFLVVLKNTKDIDYINMSAKKILKNFESDYIFGKHKIFITASMGVSIYPNNGTDVQTLIKNAEIALYRAKDQGKNNIQFCTNEIAQQVQKRSLLDFHMRQAVLDEEFILHYQPKFSLKENKITGVESLLRWNSPKVGLIYPGEFIPTAESNGLIIPIGERLLKMACSQGLYWKNNNLPVFEIAVNFSSRQFNSWDFIKKVESIITESQFNPEYLEFEITENILMDHTRKNVDIINELKKMGIKITIDDFGTKYSSLNYLKYFSIDKLKIDASFIKEMTTSRSTRSIVKAIIVMAHSLGVTVIAEGVETKSQIDFLQENGCDEVQGFYYSHPLKGEEIQNFIMNRVHLDS